MNLGRKTNRDRRFQFRGSLGVGGVRSCRADVGGCFSVAFRGLISLISELGISFKKEQKQKDDRVLCMCAERYDYDYGYSYICGFDYDCDCGMYDIHHVSFPPGLQSLAIFCVKLYNENIIISLALLKRAC